MFTDRFNELLEENGLNRKQFAEKSGIPYTTVIGWTTLSRLPDYTALVKIADFFHCSLDYITERNDESDVIRTPFTVTHAEQNLLYHFRALSQKHKELATKLIIALDAKQTTD